MTTTTATPSPGLVWHKSSYSGSAGGECVEVAVAPGMVHIRDSKDLDSPTLSVSPRSWSLFVEFAAERIA
ncbi:DUF397 domain-containing protein [Streptomyces sp. NPDC058989]|uniref:DUF397 domain-containing protein n=1 Tax=Streptomyces sp. NPDC058989 TaxID=3346686 RepID=UPI0036C2E3BB